MVSFLVVPVLGALLAKKKHCLASQAQKLLNIETVRQGDKPLQEDNQPRRRQATNRKAGPGISRRHFEGTDFGFRWLGAGRRPAIGTRTGRTEDSSE